MKTYETFFQGRQKKRRPVTGGLLCGALALVAAAVVFAPARAEAQVVSPIAPNQSYGIYKCSASYVVDYSYTDTRVTGVDFTGGRYQRFNARAQYYMVVDNAGSVDLIYFDTKTLKYSRITNAPYDCFHYLTLAVPNKSRLTISECNLAVPALDIGLGNVDGDRCEVWNLSGETSPRGNQYAIKDPGIVGPTTFFSFAPSVLNGTSCRVTCYNTGREHYVETNLFMNDFSYAGPYQSNGGSGGTGNTLVSGGSACVSGRYSCKLDRNLTINYINVTNNGITTVENYLISLGYPLAPVVNVTWAVANNTPAVLIGSQVPFLP